MGPLGAILVLVICSLCFSYALRLNVFRNLRNEVICSPIIR